MKSTGSWSTGYYHPLGDGDPLYITRIAPGKDRIRLEWLPDTSVTPPYRVFFRQRGDGDWQSAPAGETGIDLEGLAEDCDYEFYVSDGHRNSQPGLARTGEVPGTVVNYLHPEDPKYAFSGQHLCSPSLLRLPDGTYLASCDLFDGGAPQNLTLIFRSQDGGRTWHHLTELFPCFWGTLFFHQNRVWMLATSTEYGDVLIGCSEDGGKTFCTPTVLGRGAAQRMNKGWHKSSNPVLLSGSRLWTSVDYGSHKKGGFMSTLLSAPADADLLDPASWVFTDPLPYSPAWTGAVAGDDRGFLEGNAVEAPDGTVCNLLRYSTDRGTPAYGKIPILTADAANPERQLQFRQFADFPGNLSKFDIKRDPVTGVYVSLCSRITDPEHPLARNVLALAVSEDLVHWRVACDVLDYAKEDPAMVGFQYVSLAFDGDDLIFLSRTAFNHAQNFHDNNYLTFHRIPAFRERFAPKIQKKEIQP